MEFVDKLSGYVLPETEKNCLEWLHYLPEWGKQAVDELIERQLWDELNDRFFKNLEFGTGGMRSRTISTITTKAEQGKRSAFGAPEHAAIGSTCLNDFNIARATIALFCYCATQTDGPKKLIIAHDVRHFSEYFAKITAKIWNYLGGKAILFDGPRSTPQLSFSVRKYNAIAGIVITASHNPSHDNGYKVYFKDGGQVVEPHASKIIEKFNQVSLKEAVEILNSIGGKSLQLQYFEADADKLYMQEVIDNMLYPNVFLETPISVVFTPIHGTGDIITAPLFRELNIKSHFVEEQMVHDPQFSTVKSPNPENFEVFDLAIKKAKAVNAELIIGTDPDADRVAICVRNARGDYENFSGNLTGALLAEFRITQAKKLGWMSDANVQHAAFIKTFVTSPLQEKIARHHGLKCINTLTGFKWIGEKLNDYENILQQKLIENNLPTIDYVNTSAEERRKLLLQYSTFFVIGGEESYGYLASNNVRDKDANAATIMICEMLACLKKEKKTLIDFRDEIFSRYGYYGETQLNLYFEGASGAQKIKNILHSYENNPPSHIGNFHVTHITDFAKEDLRDVDGKKVPAQQFLIIELDNGYRYAVRGSGTEPKIKFYIFGNMNIATTVPDAAEETKRTMHKLAELLESDARTRADEP